MGRRPRYDAVVIGGGPAGSAAATTLARTGRAVLLVDGRPAGRTFRIGEGGPPGLDGAVDDVFGTGTFAAADHLRSHGNRAAWGADHLIGTDFMFNPFGSGWHLDRVSFDARLLTAATAAGATIHTTADGWPDFDAPVVIDASGRRAAYARRCGANLVTHDRLTAVVAVTPRSRDDRDTTTTVEAVETGWWYTSAIPGDRRVVAFLTDGDLLPPGIRSADRFVELLASTRHIARVAESRPEALMVVAAGTAHLDLPVGAGWLAAGDAAASFDPLSSQGILTAVLMGRDAAEHIDDPDAFASRYRSIIDHHRIEQQAIYALEQRWPDSPFWARRGVSSPPGPQGERPPR